MQFVCYQNGEFLSQVDFPLTSLGFTRGYAAFELLRTYNYHPFCLEEHLERFQRTAKKLRLPYPDHAEWVVHTLIEKNNSPNLLIRLYLSEDELSQKPHFLALTGPLTVPTETQYRDGIAIITTNLERQFPEIKTTSYLPAILALKEATDQGAEDAIFVNKQGELLELTKSNFFAVFKNKLYTATEGVLHGITRGVVLELAKELSLPIETTPLPLSAIPYFEEAFATSTIREVLPISKINSTPIPLGPIAERLRLAFPQKIPSLTKII